MVIQKMMKPRNILDARPLVERIYMSHSAGCCLHIVLDDGNIEDDDVAFCADLARERTHETCLALATILQAASKTQRRKLCHLR